MSALCMLNEYSDKAQDDTLVAHRSTQSKHSLYLEHPFAHRRQLPAVIQVRSIPEYFLSTGPC